MLIIDSVLSLRNLILAYLMVEVAVRTIIPYNKVSVLHIKIEIRKFLIYSCSLVVSNHVANWSHFAAKLT